MSKQSKASAYTTVFKINKAYKKDFAFGQVLNMMAKRWDSWKEFVEDAQKDQVRSDQVNLMEQFLFFMTWLLTVPIIKKGEETEYKKRPRFKTIKRMLPKNPNGDRTPKEILKRYKEGESLRDLHLSETERIEVIEVDETVGGIKPFRIVQIIWGVHKILVDELGDAYTPGDLNEEVVKKCAKKYREAVEAKRKAKYSGDAQKQKNQSDVSENGEEPIIEDVKREYVESELTADEALALIEKGELKTTELETEKFMDEIYEIAPRGIKGAITRRKKALVE